MKGRGIFEMTIGKKLTLSFVTLLAFSLILGYACVSAVHKLGNALDAAVNQSAKKIDLIGAMRDGFADVDAQVRRAQVAYAIQTLDQKKNCAVCHTSEWTASIAPAFGAAVAHVNDRIAALRPMSGGSEQTVLDDLRSNAATTMVTYQKYAKQASGGQFEEAHAVLRDELFPVLERMNEAAKQLTDQQRTSLRAAGLGARGEVSRCRWTAFVLIGFNLLIGCAGVAAVYHTARALRTAVTQMGGSAEVVADASAELSASSQSLAQDTCKQAATLEEISAASEQITCTARQNAENADSAATHMAQVDRQVGIVNRTIQEMGVSMAEIQGASSKISEILTVIDGISFQTNILALNAAVEAARAGTAGAGFAVVADEVRNLAHRSAQAAKDTAAIIEGSIDKSKEGGRKLDELTRAIASIFEGAVQVKKLVDAVDTASQQQTQGIEQISQGILQMQLVTQKSAANAEESSATAAELTSQVSKLRTVAQTLRTMVDGALDRT